MAENKLNQIGTLDIKGKDCIKRVYSIHGISPTLNTNGGGVIMSQRLSYPMKLILLKFQLANSNSP